MRVALNGMVIAALSAGVPSQARAQGLDARATDPQGTTATASLTLLRDQFRAEAARVAIAQNTVTIPVPRDEEESWAKRHPVATGALTGLLVGGVLGLALSDGSNHFGPPSPLAEVVVVGGMGAGIGAVVGAVVSAIRD